MGILTELCGGGVAGARRREFGPARLVVDDDGDLFAGLALAEETQVWMSHGDRVESIPRGWRVLAHSANSPVAAFSDASRRMFGVQFHPEVAHTERGSEVLRNFLFRICGCRPVWTMESFVERAVRELRERVGERGVICAVSGGVDSAVVAVLVNRAVGDRLACIFVDNGLLRAGETQEVPRVLS